MTREETLRVDRCSCGAPKRVTSKNCRKCNRHMLGRKKELHPCWTGGCREIDRDGYVRVYEPDHPWQRGRMISEHVLIMERHLNRRISADEIVHHVNHDRRDNRIENLILMSRSEHSRHHRASDVHMRERAADGRFI